MANKPVEGLRIVTLEKFDPALLWKIDQLREDPEFGMNRTFTLQRVLWLGLQHLNMTKGAVRAEYDDYLAERQSR